MLFLFFAHTMLVKKKKTEEDVLSPYVIEKDNLKLKDLIGKEN